MNMRGNAAVDLTGQDAGNDAEDKAPEQELVEYSEGLGDLIRAKKDEAAQIKKDQAKLNDRAKAIRSDLAAQGITSEAFKLLLKIEAMSPEQRLAFDNAYMHCRKATGHPLEVRQGSLVLE